MPDADVTSLQSLRSQAALTGEHLGRLAALADADHEVFTGRRGRPEYRSRRLAVLLAQGAALHYLDGCTGVKDLDVWTFYARIPGTRFPADRRETHADFGPSALGRQTYDLSEARNARERALWQRWSAYSGRRVDFLMRALPVEADAPGGVVAVEADAPGGVVAAALRDWLANGSRSTSARKPSSWYLARKAVVLLHPQSCRGEVLWRPR